jgi:hypothetical protein
MAYNDISEEWRIKNNELRVLSEAISLADFGLEKLDRSIQSEFKILSFMCQTQHHVEKLYKNPDQFPLNRNAQIMTFDSTRVVLGKEEDR